MKARKGGNYERELCKEFSLWWTHGKNDDVFWRTAGSGGRATGRTKRGQKTHGSYGDIAAVNPIGAPLIDLLTIEVKRGYPHYHIGDMLDYSQKAGRQRFEEHFDQVYESWQKSGSFSWALICRRDNREPFIFVGMEFAELVIGEAEPQIISQRGHPAGWISGALRFRLGWHKTGKTWKSSHSKMIGFVGMSLSRFFTWCSPEEIILLSSKV